MGLVVQANRQKRQKKTVKRQKKTVKGENKYE